MSYYFLYLFALKSSIAETQKDEVRLSESITFSLSQNTPIYIFYCHQFTENIQEAIVLVLAACIFVSYSMHKTY